MRSVWIPSQKINYFAASHPLEQPLEEQLEPQLLLQQDDSQQC
jgi:hypothetical protein